MHSLYVLAIIAVMAMLITNKESFSIGDSDRCNEYTKDSSIYGWTQRILGEDGQWKCPDGSTDTGCNWGMGEEVEQKQCRKEKKYTKTLCSAVVSVFSEANFTSIDKYPTQNYKIPKCGGSGGLVGRENILPLADGKSGYSSIIVPAGLTATVTFKGVNNVLDFVGPVKTAFPSGPLYNDKAVSVRVKPTPKKNIAPGVFLNLKQKTDYLLIRPR